jgi:hypothetical protein
VRRPLHFLKGPCLDLSNSLGGDAKLDGKFVQCKRRIHEPARLEDVTFAVIEDRERHAKRPSSRLRFLALGKTRFLVGTVLHQTVLPLDRIVIIIHWHIQGNVTAHPPIHFNDVLFANAKLIGNEGYLIGPQIAFLERGHSALRLGQIKK